MDSLAWEKLTEVQGRLHAELLQSYLEAHGIESVLFQEGVGHWVYPVTLDALGRVEIFVPRPHLARAQTLLQAFTTESE